jgi:hypothetical protein
MAVRCQLDRRSNDRRSLIPLGSYYGLQRRRRDASVIQRIGWRLLYVADDNNLTEPSPSFLPEEQPAHGTPTNDNLSFDDEDGEDDSSSTTNVTITLMVAVSSATLACLVLACFVAMHIFHNKTDLFSTHSHTTTFDGSLTHRKTAISLVAFPSSSALNRMPRADEFFLDLTLYGNAEPVSVSPMSSSMVMSSSSSDSDGAAAAPLPIQRDDCRETSAKTIDRTDQKGILFVAHTAQTESSTGSSNSPGSEESRDDESEPRCAGGPSSSSTTYAVEDFVYDIFLARPPQHDPSNDDYYSALDRLGLVLEDPFCAVTHPLVIRVADESPFAGRLCPGDFILSVNDTCLMGKTSASIVQHVFAAIDHTGMTKFTVMTARSLDTAQHQQHLGNQERDGGEDPSRAITLTV